MLFSALSLDKSASLFSLPVSIPSPPRGVWYLFGFFPLRAYALFIITGIIISIFWVKKRYEARGGDPELIYDIAPIIIISGIAGGRIYHVLTSWRPYFGENGDPWSALRVWEGGLGIIGAVTLGTICTLWYIRRRKIAFAPLADAVAPALLFSQALGRLGNYFNQEVFGLPTNLPWGLVIDPQHRPVEYLNYATFHPTFLYELLWNLCMVGVILLVEKRYLVYGGQTFGLYMVLYGCGRVWIENFRVDTNDYIFGIRLNYFAAIIVFVVGLVIMFICARLQLPRYYVSKNAKLDTSEDNQVNKLNELENVTGQQENNKEGELANYRTDI